MKHVYSFIRYYGASNCSQCDNDTSVNEYKRDDNLLEVFCSPCENRLGL